MSPATSDRPVRAAHGQEGPDQQSSGSTGARRGDKARCPEHNPFMGMCQGNFEEFRHLERRPYIAAVAEKLHLTKLTVLWYAF